MTVLPAIQNSRRQNYNRNTETLIANISVYNCEEALFEPGIQDKGKLGSSWQTELYVGICIFARLWCSVKEEINPPKCVVMPCPAECILGGDG